MPNLWALGGFLCGGVGIYLALRHQDYDGHYKALSKFIGIGVSALIFGCFTALFTFLGQRALRRQPFAVQCGVLGLMNLAFLVVPEVVTVMVEKGEREKRKAED
jgi:hypothetical protein